MPRTSQQTVIFDLDDTLIHCNKYFVDVLGRFVRLMKEWFPDIPEREIKDKQSEFDLAGVHAHGLIKERFPQSLAEVYDYFSHRTGRRIRTIERDRLIRLGYEVYEHKIEPYPGMHETLIRLEKDGYRLGLFTGGDVEVQMNKVHQLNLERYFGDRIFITSHKNTAAFQRMLERLDSRPEDTWMVGNSPRTDIIPALESGAHAIYIPSELEWAYNQVEIDVESGGALIRLSRVAEVPDAIREYSAKS